MLVATLAGAWIAHVLEYLRVWGSTGYGSLVGRSVHTYNVVVDTAGGEQLQGPFTVALR